MTWRQIADKLGVSCSALHVWRKIKHQAETVQERIRDPALITHLLLIEVTETEARKGVFPNAKLGRVLGAIKDVSPAIVLVDICLHEKEQIADVDPAGERSATWTGPALMAAIRTYDRNQKMASYSAYPTGSLTDINQQKIRYHVADTKHWSVRELTASKVKDALG